jgi:hypothetical protein
MILVPVCATMVQNWARVFPPGCCVRMYSCSPAHSVRDIFWYECSLNCIDWKKSIFKKRKKLPPRVLRQDVLLFPCSQYPGYCLGTNDPLYVCSLICTPTPLLTVSGIFPGYGWSLERLLPYFVSIKKNWWSKEKKFIAIVLIRFLFFLLSFLFYARKYSISAFKYIYQTKCLTVRESWMHECTIKSTVDEKSQWQKISRLLLWYLINLVKHK